ncbi:3,4-dihydroxy-2-butanone-4-phosphate synthase [Micrococcus lylae]|uniref:3,4-dihydroxy-2-butanone-4-phosphate synthase n=1 Tax=Micrococcus lylae TaxID=1273 RepID=UPI0021A71D45|nr:3,4-dihydroxy-2-butanone-4-phosphate synthase [Micrococcus lylae]MCT2007309.1 3,4-dihydroxy-2-butanone-4-phosphate synthase [Micrococcus lylae]MCT2071017.1 3,4-dihydroxy-2-butanone-4-phosphate synthase [Micrococcus lylae]
MSHGQDLQQTVGVDPVRLDPVEEAIAAIAAGRAVVVVDDEDRENEGDLIFAASRATAELTAFTIRHTSGVLCTPMPAAWAERLALPPMTDTNEDPKGTAYTVSVDAAAGVTTGISAADRARTLRVLAHSGSAAGDLTRPGHVFPLRAVDGGVRERAGHTEAGVELCRLAGLAPVAAIAELTHDDGTMMRLPALREFADEHGLVLVSIEDLADFLTRIDDVPAEACLPTARGPLRIAVHPDPATGAEHVLLTSPDLDPSAGPVTVRVHSECLTGDVLGSLRCDCGPQLQRSLEATARHGGAVLYLRGHEGRGIGLANKVRAYRLQEQGLDTVDANLALGLPAEGRDFRAAARILADAGITCVRLVTNNPVKLTALRRAGIDVVERVPAPAPENEHNRAYLAAKRERMGHLPALGESAPEIPGRPADPLTPSPADAAGAITRPSETEEHHA